jgi:hypothetical protein
MQSSRATFGIGIAVLIYWLGLWSLQGLRSDHMGIGVLLWGLWAAGRQIRKLFWFLLPILLTGIIYDSQRFYGDYLRGRVRVEEPYLFDLHLFGIRSAEGTLQTPNEWLQLHTHWALDLITGFYYLAFIGIFALTAAYFQFWLSHRGNQKISAAKLSWEAPRLMWSFFWVNIVGYTTYYWYPAAPPWYVALYGLGPARMDTPANPGGAIRFDEILGTQFFTGMYGKSADVFGAIPSLHVAYPFLAMLFAWRWGALRAHSTFFYLIMCFAAVYLNHHYLLDIIWGTAYALGVYWAIHRLAEKNLILRRDSLQLRTLNQ